MGTEDLIKKLKASNNVKPTQLKVKISTITEDLPKVEEIKLESLQTVEQKIEEEVAKLKEEKINVDKKYWNNEFAKITKQFEEIKQHIHCVDIKVTDLVNKIDTLQEDLAIKKEVHKVKISFWKRLINKCR